MRFLDKVDFKLYVSNGGVNALGKGKNEISPFLTSTSKNLGFPSKRPLMPPGKMSFRHPCTQQLINHGQLVNHAALIKFD